ncbi:MAG: caspase domain-containing protein [Cytophagaceae bacterium]
MTKKKILYIHGIGNKSKNQEWTKEWENSISAGLGNADPNNWEFCMLDIDHHFEKKMKNIQYKEAFKELLKGMLGKYQEEYKVSRGLIDNAIRWTAGMVALWVTDEELREELDKELHNKIKSFQPDIIFSHSLGTLISYNYFRKQTAIGNHFNLVWITSGSQISHSSLRGRLGSVILPLNVKLWINFHNMLDKAFAYKSIKNNILEASNKFVEIKTTFLDLPINHDGIKYIRNKNAQNHGWPLVLPALQNARVLKNFLWTENIEISDAAAQKRKPNRKALLVGINEYQDSSNNLEGCINDVFRMSEVLQESGFAPEEIRVLLDKRATAENIKERLSWLLEDAQENDLRFFFFAGHGTVIPSENDWDGEHKSESLVPHDFDWTSETAFTDKDFVELYSQISLKVNFITVLDCCHSGGMSRGAGMNVRGIDPPDDIRHKELRWDKSRHMWVPRKLKLAEENLFDKTTKDKQDYTGSDGSTFRFGRAVPLWQDVKTFKEIKKNYGLTGPFVPVVLEACRENEFAYEYKHGVTSFGAFTYAFTTILRQYRNRKKPITFTQLMEITANRMKELGYQQQPGAFGPKEKVNGKYRWNYE